MPKNYSRMKKTLLALALLSCVISGAQTISVIPQPVSVITTNAGTFHLTNNTVVGYRSPVVRQVAAFVSNKLSTATGYKIRAGNDGNILLNINKVRNAKIGDEGYTLIVSQKNILVSANTVNGLFYGAQTLIQLLPKEIESNTKTKAAWTIPAVDIIDYPRFAWRGLMLDVSRHFFNKEDVKKYIDNMAMYKYNVFHWHLTDDHGWRIQIKALPKLTEIGSCRVQRYGKFGKYEMPRDNETATDCGFYTQDDIREVIAYAAERHIQILPEIDIPGHSMAAIAAYPQLSCTKDMKGKVNPGSAYAI